MLPPPGGRPSPAGPFPAPTPAPTPTPPATKLAKRRPRAQQLPTLPAARPVTSAEKIALATYEAELGGRPSLVQKLAHAQLDKNGYRLVQLLADPENDLLSLAEVCQRAAVSVGKVSEWVKAALTAKANLLATLHIAEHTPEVARSVMVDAQSGERTCLTCQGTGSFPGPSGVQTSCGVCGGRGTTRYEPELGLRKVALALSGLLNPAGSGTKVSITNNNLAVAGASSASAALDRMTELTDKLLYGSGRDRLAAADDDGDQEFSTSSTAESAPPLDGEVVRESPDQR